MTTYKILYMDSGHWSDGYPDVEARSAKAAISKSVEDKQVQEGQYVAVPIRSWRPVTVKVETETRLKFS